MGLSGVPARTGSTQPTPQPGFPVVPPGGSKTSTGSIDRDLGTSGKPLGGSEKDECIEDGALGRFLDACWTPKNSQSTSKEYRGSLFGASWELLGNFLGLSWSPFGAPDASRTSKSDVKSPCDANLSSELALRAPNSFKMNECINE